ncbi:MAG: tRNA (N(6)-L-threonylcarbamoyladenosine(37)-C(2))-methylthiotransferase MtaB [Deltaproteobacteria bacterium]|nr:tRNA (N(6)-L-threonylcarbamoyladenosine(37)-C(2))-methylthiotransferase MtaB [Deltaproteobacteria bacterium]
MKYFIFTTGCRSNQYDSWVIGEKLKKIGCQAERAEEAEIIIVNACTVTESAERDAKRLISRIRRAKSGVKIILTGCHPQVYPQKNFGSDLVLGQKERFDITSYLDKEGIFVSELDDYLLERLPSDFGLTDKTRFFLKIQDGCDMYCTYCVVPYARGRPRSRPLDEILRFMAELKKRGVKEVVLSGIEIASYRDPESGIDLKGLLRILEVSETPERIRLSSCDPLYIDSEFITILESSRKLARSIHIPLQSGSDSVLERMGRKYKSGHIKEILGELKRKIPNIGIGLDVIAGFPGETESEFTETLRFIEALDVYYLHVFPFSPRENTEASKMPNLVDEKIKKERVRVLKELDRRMRLRFYMKHLGLRLEILPEKKIYRGHYMKGLSDNYIPVLIPYEGRLVNEFTYVVPKEIKEGKLIGVRIT